MVSMTAARDVLCTALQPVRRVGCTRWAASLPTLRQPTCRSTNNVTLPRPQLPHSGRYRCDIWPVSSSSTGRVVNVRYWHKADIPSCTAHVRFWGSSGHRFLVFGVLVAQIVKTAASDPSEKGSSAKFGGPFRAQSLATPARALRGDSSRAKRKVDDC